MSRRKTNQDFINESIQKYGQKYNYSKTNYIKNNTKVTLICNIHNFEFQQTPANHLYFEGCPICYAENQRNLFRKTTQNFIKDAKQIHGETYDYSKTAYSTIHEKVEIICKIHGPFWQYPTNHLDKKCGCPKCAITKLPGGYFNQFFKKYPEKKNIPGILYFVEISHPTEGKFYKLGITNKSIKERFIGNQFKDFIISEIWTLSGTLFDVWRYEQFLSQIFKNYRFISPLNFNGKTECYSIKIPKPKKIINIFDFEMDKKDIILSRLNIKNKLNPNIIQKIYARKCQIKIVSQNEEMKFLDKTHIQGYVPSKIALGLFLNSRLISIMTFGTPRFNKDYQWELLRFSTELNTIISGGASKLFHHFIKNYNPKSIISYSDNRWNKGLVYALIGMKYSHSSTPNYWYIKDDKKLSRIQCQKHKLHNFLKNFDPKETEFENMVKNGYTKITDNGNDVYVWDKPF